MQRYHFQFTQEIYRNVQNHGLAGEYNKGNSVTQLVRKLFALPFLPHRKMNDAFNSIREESNHDDLRIQNLLRYYDNNWLKSTIWYPKNICVYQRLVRTNNDIEGYHNRLNGKCKTVHPPFYKLLEVLYAEAIYTDSTAKIVSNRAVKMHRKKKTKEVQRMICLIWDQYDDLEIDEQQLLEAISRFMAFSIPDDE